MAYTAASYYPSNTTLTVFTWSTPENPNPRMAQPGTSTQTTLYFTAAPKDRNGAVITSGFLMGIKLNDGSVETVYVPPGALDATGTIATGVVRGIRPEGLDFTTGDSSFAGDFDGDAPVFCNVAQVYHRMMIGALNGTIATGGTTIKTGDGTDSDMQWIVYNADTNKPWFGYDHTTNQFVYSNDGVSSTPFGTGAGVTGGDGISVTGGDIDIDLTDTIIFKSTSAGAGDSGKVPRLNGSGVLDNSFMPTLLVGGTSSDASTLHYHEGTISNIPAGEAVDGSSTPQLVYISDGSGGRTAGRFYKADADDTTNIALNNIGFVIVNASSVGTSYQVKTGVVSGFTGLTAGSLYYSSTTAGAITATASTFGQRVVGRAISTTQLYVFQPEHKTAHFAGAANVAIGATSTITIYTGYKAKSIEFTCDMKSQDATGANDSVVIFNETYDGTNWGGGYLVVVPSYTFGITPAAPQNQPGGGANRSTLTMAVTFNSTNVVITFTSTIYSGTGSNNSWYNISGSIIPY